MESLILVAKQEGVATITLNRPEAANALSVQMLGELQAAIDELRWDQAIRSVIVTGAGEKAFCAGADLKERAGMNPQQVRQTVALIRDTIHALQALPKPVIAAVNGVAFGGGTELALACDIRIASSAARFALTETSLGIIPGAGGTQRLPRLIGPGRAKELIFSARRVEAEEALQIGLVEYVVPVDALMERAQELAGRIAQNAPIALTQAKFAIDQGLETSLANGLAIEQKAYEVTIPTRDREEGLLAFREKRAPRYTGE
ncbi:enoyl-CoA hydratase [Brevibacillus fluminis]|uniref:Enoyl-CoA hydratase n=1 Tax=Brevibacillus fluminis TaxID=511487 RepID=A0A3M8DI98_9BACL|nr:enoyl-CoA hydratase [Brevibacillus fluminis]RNB87746.1 enoyl-CoA hydratase [Brevibacillus fluminis]